jgi:hypothetical protein
LKGVKAKFELRIQMWLIFVHFFPSKFAKLSPEKYKIFDKIIFIAPKKGYL